MNVKSRVKRTSEAVREIIDLIGIQEAASRARQHTKRDGAQGRRIDWL